MPKRKPRGKGEPPRVASSHRSAALPRRSAGRWRGRPWAAAGRPCRDRLAYCSTTGKACRTTAGERPCDPWRWSGQARSAARSTLTDAACPLLFIGRFLSGRPAQRPGHAQVLRADVCRMDSGREIRGIVPTDGWTDSKGPAGMGHHRPQRIRTCGNEGSRRTAGRDPYPWHPAPFGPSPNGGSRDCAASERHITDSARRCGNVPDTTCTEPDRARVRSRAAVRCPSPALARHRSPHGYCAIPPRRRSGTAGSPLARRPPAVVVRRSSLRNPRPQGFPTGASA